MEELKIPSIIFQGMATFWWAFPIILLGWLAETSWFKGKFGEFLVNRAFKKHLNPESYTLLHDVTLQTKNGSTQIDQVVISPFGIFLILEFARDRLGYTKGGIDSSRLASGFA